MDFTIADVLAWARTKPANEQYNFCDAAECALGQFLREMRGWRPDEIYVADPYFEQGIEKTPLGRALCDNYTFGALVTRLEALCPDTVVTPSEWTKLDAYLTDIEMARA